LGDDRRVDEQEGGSGESDVERSKEVCFHVDYKLKNGKQSVRVVCAQKCSTSGQWLFAPNDSQVALSEDLLC